MKGVAIIAVSIANLMYQGSTNIFQQINIICQQTLNFLRYQFKVVTVIFLLSIRHTIFQANRAQQYFYPTPSAQHTNFVMRKIQEEDSISYYSNNELNMAFIAENSRDIQSLSLCGSRSQRSVESGSQISRINSVPGSPYGYFQPEISNMLEWPNQDPNIFFEKKNPNFSQFRKRPTRHAIPELIQQINQEERQLEKMNKCTKKRIGQKNKIITIQPASNQNQNQYGLRSKAKLTVTGVSLNGHDQDSSSEELREMVAEIGSKKGYPKNSSRKMLAE